MARPFTVVAIIAAHNEADVIEHVVRDLIDQGVSVYFIDDDSTDGTREIVERHVGRGVLAVERFDGRLGVFELAAILKRKAEIAHSLDADWFINHDADEFRESPWLGMALTEAVEHVDKLGFNAIDFALLEFWPVDDSFQPGHDVRQSLQYFRRPQSLNRLQIRCWKKRSVAVGLVEQGGHEPVFPGRDVFPIPFLLRHYPVRSESHGRRKVFDERRPRFAPEEVASGWHRQYDGLNDDAQFVQTRESLTPYDPVAVRRSLITSRFSADPATDAVSSAENHTDSLLEKHERMVRERDQALATLNEQTLSLASLRNDFILQTRIVGELERSLEKRRQELHSLSAAMDAMEQRVREMHDSLSWRVTAPARAAYRVLTRRGA